MSLPLTLIAANTSAAAQHATPEASREASPATNQTRGEGGELRILQWQAPTTLILHAATAKKDKMAASLVSEPLMSYDPEEHFSLAWSLPFLP